MSHVTLRLRSTMNRTLPLSAARSGAIDPSNVGPARRTVRLAPMDCVDAVEALAAAGVQLPQPVIDLRGGSPELAFTDALARADEQRATLPAKLVDDVRALAGRVLARYPSAAAAPINQAISRIAARAV